MKNTCCFFGHRRIDITDSLTEKLHSIIEHLITEEKVDTFLFVSKSCFDDLCYNITSYLKIIHPHIKRIYARVYPKHITDEYREYLLTSYENTYYPDIILNAGKATYIKRNFDMINKSKFCIIYFNDNYSPPGRNSGTRIAYEYAKKHNKIIINLFDCRNIDVLLHKKGT